MDLPLMETTSKKTTKGGHEYDDSLADMHRLKSLLFNNRRDFWFYSLQDPELLRICCRDEDTRVRIMICSENSGASRTQNVSDARHFHQILLEESRASPALLVFINILDQASGKLSLSWPMLQELVFSLEIMPQFLDLLPLKTNNQRPRDSTAAFFATSKINAVEEICLSLYHCCIQQSTPGKKHSALAVRAMFYIQPQKERLRWISIGAPALWDLQRVYFDAAHPGLLNQSLTFLTFIATNGWQKVLNALENDLNTELDDRRDSSINSNHIKLINALIRLQSRILRANGQIATNISVLRSLAKAYPSQKVDSFAYDNHALEELERRAAQTTFLAHQVQNAIEQASRVAAHMHATKMETFSWNNLKLNYAVESSTRQTTVIFAILAPAIFTSTFFSTNFFSISTDEPTLRSQSLWIWFATTVPLTISFFVLGWLWNKWQVRSGLSRITSEPRRKKISV